MKINETYRFNRATICISSEEFGRRIPLMVPAGGIVTFLNGPLNGERLVDVQWEGKTVMMFTVDVRDRATLITRLTKAAIA